MPPIDKRKPRHVAGYPDPAHCPPDPMAKQNELAAIRRRQEQLSTPQLPPRIRLAFLLACQEIGADPDKVVARKRHLLRNDTLRGQRYKIYVIMRNAGLSYPEIASPFRASHTTVLAALRRGPGGNGLSSCEYTLETMPNGQSGKDAKETGSGRG